MEDREFSSPVCYLDYDTYQITTPKPETGAFCNCCSSFIAALYRSTAGEDRTVLECLSSDEKLKFVLSQQGWVYKMEGDVIKSAERGCPLCVVIFDGLGEEERKKLNAWRKAGIESEEMMFEFVRDVNPCDIRFRMAPSRTRDPVLEVKG